MVVAADRIQLRNPDPKKKGPRIAKDTYAVLRTAALASLSATGQGMTLAEFRSSLEKRLNATKGWDRTRSASWYGMAIKLDLEAKGELRRIGSPQRLIRA